MKHFSLTLYVYGKDLRHESVTAALGSEPTYTHSSGVTYRGEPPRPLTRELSVWEFSKDYDHGEEIGTALSDFLQMFDGRAQALATADGVESVRLFVYLVPKDETVELLLSPEEVRKIGALGASLYLTYSPWLDGDTPTGDVGVDIA